MIAETGEGFQGENFQTIPTPSAHDSAPNYTQESANQLVGSPVEIVLIWVEGNEMGMSYSPEL